MRSLFVAALTVLACACAKATVAPAGSQTHFLESCDQSCPDPYACYCGVCTLPCGDSSTCEEHADDAQCVMPVGNGTAECAVSTTVCDVECEGDSDCVALGAAFECSEGRCREPAVPVAGEGGMGGSGGMGGTGGTGGTTSDAGPDGDAGGPDMGVICDGSDDVRLGYSSSGGQVEITYEFTNPYGHAFFFVDGQCRYYVSSNLVQGVHTGTLTEAQSERLAADVHWSELAELSAAPEVQSCPDAGGVTVWTADYAAMCTCGCDEGPLAEAKSEAIAGAYESIAMLEEEGTGLTGPLSVIAHEIGVASGTEPIWPLDRPMTDIDLLIQDIYTDGVGEPSLFEDSADTDPLRALRSAAAAISGPLQVREAGIVYELYMRDELPLERADAITAFLDGRQP